MAYNKGSFLYKPTEFISELIFYPYAILHFMYFSGDIF